MKTLEHQWIFSVLSEERLSCVFHPIVEAANPQQVLGYEVLLRGRGLDGEVIPAVRLLQASRELGLIARLDMLARLLAIREIARFAIPGMAFINFLPSAIYDPATCLRTTFEVVAQLGIEPSRIVFEVVETESLEDPEHIQNVLETYRSHGFGVTLDDIGSGYSGLSWVGLLKPDYVKIERGLIQNLPRNEVSQVIVRKIIELSHELGIQVIAEGIETEEHLAWLQKHGVDYVQGFLVALPGSPPPAPRLVV